LRRLEEKKHNWKFSVGDLKERERWDDMQYYEEAINNTSTDYAPWYVILTIKKCAVILWVKSFGRNAETHYSNA
jgi:polyphosphate kinase 2 (PPK2 family)